MNINVTAYHIMGHLLDGLFEKFMQKNPVPVLGVVGYMGQLEGVPTYGVTMPHCHRNAQTQATIPNQKP